MCSCYIYPITFLILLFTHGQAHQSSLQRIPLIRQLYDLSKALRVANTSQVRMVAYRGVRFLNTLQKVVLGSSSINETNRYSYGGMVGVYANTYVYTMVEKFIEHGFHVTNLKLTQLLSAIKEINGASLEENCAQNARETLFTLFELFSTCRRVAEAKEKISDAERLIRWVLSIADQIDESLSHKTLGRLRDALVEIELATTPAVDRVTPKYYGRSLESKSFFGLGQYLAPFLLQHLQSATKPELEHLIQTWIRFITELENISGKGKLEFFDLGSLGEIDYTEVCDSLENFMRENGPNCENTDKLYISNMKVENSIEPRS